MQVEAWPSTASGNHLVSKPWVSAHVGPWGVVRRLRGRDPLASAHWVGFAWLQVLRADILLHGNLEPQTDASATSLALCPFRKVAFGSSFFWSCLFVPRTSLAQLMYQHLPAK